MSMALPSGPGHDFLRLASAAQRRATLSHHQHADSAPFLCDFGFTEKALMAMHISPDDALI